MHTNQHAAFKVQKWQSPPSNEGLNVDFLSWRAYSPSLKLKAGGPPLIASPRMYIAYTQLPSTTADHFLHRTKVQRSI